jgi:hypothetical protein
MLSRQPLRSSTGFPAQGDSEAGRVLEGQVLASVLTMHGGASRTPILIAPGRILVVAATHSGGVIGFVLVYLIYRFPDARL